jgi:hypothetical protein
MIADQNAGDDRGTGAADPEQRPHATSSRRNSQRDDQLDVVIVDLLVRKAT